MSVLRVTPEFLAWLAEQGVSLRDLDSPPIAWGYVALYEKTREIAAVPVSGEAPE